MAHALGNKNELSVCIDWLSFTITEEKKVNTVLNLFGFDIEQFKYCDHGLNGYKQMLICNTSKLKVLFDGQENMGIHIDVSGSALSNFIEVFRKNKNITLYSANSGANSVTDAFITPSAAEGRETKPKTQSIKQNYSQDKMGGNPADGETKERYKNQIGEEENNPAQSVNESQYILMEVLKLIKDNGHTTRIDFAIDDIGNNYYEVEEIDRLYKNHNIKTRFKRYQPTITYENYEIVGYTAYFGSRQSEMFLRIYDKALEQKRKIKDCPEKWTRWEMEIKGDKCRQVAEKILSGVNISEFVFSLLNTYFCIIDLDDSNRSRCSINEKWIRFIGSGEKVNFIIKKPVTTIEQKNEWIINQVSRILAVVFSAAGGDVDCISNWLNHGMQKLTKNDYAEIEDYLLLHREGFEYDGKKLY